jgi:hypothetical protein
VDTMFDSFYASLYIVGQCLKLPDVTIASACVLYHRFISAIDDHNDFDLNVCIIIAIFWAAPTISFPEPAILGKEREALG